MEDKPVSKILEEIAEEMCDNYCKYSAEAKENDEGFIEICKTCPLNKL